MTDIVRTKPLHIESKKGQSGRQVALTTNYFRLDKTPKWCLCQYRVDFAPEIAIEGLRRRFIAEQKERFGGYLFDGTMIFNTKRLDSFEYVTKDREDQPYKISIKFVGEISMTSSASLQVLNLILRRAMEGLKLQQVGRNLFDAAAKVIQDNILL